MIFTLKVTSLHGQDSSDKWEATLEIDSMSPLDELHFAIQDALEFDDDHLYEFFIARTAYSRDRRSFEGESIEQKVAKLIENNEPITDGAPIIYTEKKDGVLPQYDIRTDKWEIAQSAMDLANASKIAKSKGLKKPEEPKPTEPKKPENPEPTE